MPFFGRQYKVFLLLAGPDAPPLWQANSWLPFATDIGQHLVSARGKTSVRTVQYSAPGKPVSFGRLGWDEKSHSKWIQSEANPGHVRFLHAEAWAPSWNQCERDDLAPDSYLDLVNERLLGHADKKLLFSQRLLFALASDRGDEEAKALQGTLSKWAAKLSAPVFARTFRSWGLPFGGGGFTGAIQDMAVSHLFKPGDPHARELDNASLTEPWEFLHGEV